MLPHIQGIGRAICKKLLSDHPDVFVYLGSRDAGRGAKACEDLDRELGGGCGGRLQAITLDVTDDASVAAAAATVTRGAPDGLFGLVNNAGVGFGRTVEETLATNLYGARRVTEAFLPLVQRGGRVVNIASASGPNFVAKLAPEAQPFWADPVQPVCSPQN